MTEQHSPFSGNSVFLFSTIYYRNSTVPVNLPRETTSPEKTGEVPVKLLIWMIFSPFLKRGNTSTFHDNTCCKRAGANTSGPDGRFQLPKMFAHGQSWSFTPRTHGRIPVRRKRSWAHFKVIYALASDSHNPLVVLHTISYSKLWFPVITKIRAHWD